MTIRRVLAVLAAVGCGLTLAGCSWLGALTGVAQRDPDSQVTAAGRLGASALHVGDCLVVAGLADQFREIPAVPCGEPHDAEVIYIFDMPEGRFNQAAIEAAATDACRQAMNDYVGPTWDTVMDGDLQAHWFVPSDQSWRTGDREVNCLVATMSGDPTITGSAKGIAP